MISQHNPMQTIVNDTPYWLSSVVAEKYGYKDPDGFKRKIVPETIKVLIDIGVPYYEHVIPASNNESRSNDFLLSRFACWVAALHSDGSKEGVKKARNKLSAYFDQLGLEERDLFDIRRFPLRKEISKTTRRLSSIAARAGFNKFPILNESGYKGLYGMSSRELHSKRKLKETDNLYDFMDSAELSLNLLRLNLSIMALKSMSQINDQTVEKRMYKVGLSCRLSVFESTGSYPENWVLSKNLNSIQKTLKSIIKEL